AVLRPLRGPPVELEVLEPVFVGAHPHGTRPEALLEVLLPEPRRLEDVTVGIDRAVVREADDFVAHAEGSPAASCAHAGAPVKRARHSATSRGTAPCAGTATGATGRPRVARPRCAARGRACGCGTPPAPGGGRRSPRWPRAAALGAASSAAP